jgi:hypothetical protein
MKEKDLRKKIHPKEKMSQMILDFAADYISIGETPEEKQSYLNGACSAWNFSLMDETRRKKSIERYMFEYRKINPHLDEEQCNGMLENVEKLIDMKQLLYPNIMRAVVTAEYQVIDGKEYVNVVSLDLADQKQ